MTLDRTQCLTRMKIKGFKSIGALDLEIGNINILLGANGSGKSNFLSLFDFLRNLAADRLESYVQEQGGASALLHFGSRKTEKFSIDVTIGGETNPDSGENDDFSKKYCLEFVHGNNDSMVFRRVTATNMEDLSEKERQNFYYPEKDSERMCSLGGLSVETHVREFMKGLRTYHFADTGSTARVKQTKELNVSDYLYGDAGNLAPFLYRLRRDYVKNYKNILMAIRAVAPFFKDFYLEPSGGNGEKFLLLKWLHRNHEEPLSASQLSDGTLRFICIACLFLQPNKLKPGIIILDEPELGLHPAAMEIVADLIKVAARSSQVICSTQSVTLANYFKPEDFIVVETRNGVSDFRRLKAGSFKIWLEDYGMGDIWAKNLAGGGPDW